MNRKKLQDHNIYGVSPEGHARNDDTNSGFHNVRKGNNGVELRYYNYQIFLDLPKEQKDELEEWRDEKKDKCRATNDLPEDTNGNNGNRNQRQRRKNRISTMET